MSANLLDSVNRKSSVISNGLNDSDTSRTPSRKALCNKPSSSLRLQLRARSPTSAPSATMRSIGENLHARTPYVPKTKHSLLSEQITNHSPVKSASPIKRKTRPASSPKNGSSAMTSPDIRLKSNRQSPNRGFSWDGSPLSASSPIAIDQLHSLRRFKISISESADDPLMKKNEQCRHWQSAADLFIEPEEDQADDGTKRYHLMQKSASLHNVRTTAKQKARSDGTEQNTNRRYPNRAKALKIVPPKGDLHASHHTAPVYSSTQTNRYESRILLHEEPQKTSRREQPRKTNPIQPGLGLDNATSCPKGAETVLRIRGNGTSDMAEERQFEPSLHSKQTRQNPITSGSTRCRPSDMKRVQSNNKFAHAERYDIIV